MEDKQKNNEWEFDVEEDLGYDWEENSEFDNEDDLEFDYSDISVEDDKVYEHQHEKTRINPGVQIYSIIKYAMVAYAFAYLMDNIYPGFRFFKLNFVMGFVAAFFVFKSVKLFKSTIKRYVVSALLFSPLTFQGVMFFVVDQARDIFVDWRSMSYFDVFMRFYEDFTKHPIAYSFLIILPSILTLLKTRIQKTKFKSIDFGYFLIGIVFNFIVATIITIVFSILFVHF